MERRLLVLGPEEGDDKTGTLPQRLEAYMKLNSEGLCDCLDFHQEIGVYQWHGLNGQPARQQATWRQLIRLLLTYEHPHAAEPSDAEILNYQVTKWGRRSSKTCVIELSGIPAHSYVAGSKIKKTLFDRNQLKIFTEKRIEKLFQRLSNQPPKLFVMYGARDRRHWSKVEELVCCLPQNVQPVTVALPHPVSWGLTNDYWADWGKRLQSA